MPSPASRRPDPERPVVVPRELIDPEHPELGTRDLPSPEDWLWKGRIRTGDFVVVVGDRASGKTTLLCDWMARVTSGQPFPGDPPSMTREPGEVLLFNGLDKFTETIQSRVRKSGGDPGRISLVTRDLQMWSGIPGEMPEGWMSFDKSTYNANDCRAELHQKKTLDWLGSFLRNRPKIQMVVIDNAWQHIKADSERRLLPTISELAHIARENEVTLVLSQHPNAFRQGTGAAEFIKSDCILNAARSIWRTMTPGDASVPARNVQCLKLCQTPTIPNAEQSWSVFLGDQDVLQWMPGAGPLYSNTKRAKDDRQLGNALHYIKNHVHRVGGVIEYNTLRIAAKKAGISQKWFMQVILLPVFDIDYEPYGEDELVQLIGFPADLEKRRNDPHPKPLKISNPPGGAASTSDELPYEKQFANWLKATNAPPDPLPVHPPDFPDHDAPERLTKRQRAGDAVTDGEQTTADRPGLEEPRLEETSPEQARPGTGPDRRDAPAKSRARRETINLRKESWEELEDRRHSELLDAFCQAHLGTPNGWTPPQTQAEWKTFCEGALGYFAERLNVPLPKELPFDLLSPLVEIFGCEIPGGEILGCEIPGGKEREMALPPGGGLPVPRPQSWGDVARRMDRVAQTPPYPAATHPAARPGGATSAPGVVASPARRPKSKPGPRDLTDHPDGPPPEGVSRGKSTKPSGIKSAKPSRRKSAKPNCPKSAEPSCPKSAEPSCGSPPASAQSLTDPPAAPSTS